MSLVDYRYKLAQSKTNLEIRARELAKRIEAISGEMETDITKYLKQWWVCNDNSCRKDIIYIDRYDETYNCFKGWGFGYLKNKAYVEINLDKTLQYWHIPLLKKISIKQVAKIYHSWIYPIAHNERFNNRGNDITK